MSTISTREAFGQSLVSIGETYPEMIVLDGDVQNSTYAELFAKVFPERFLECYIAEQNMVGVAVGLAKVGYQPWVTSFSVFLTRAFDQIRMAAISGSTIRFCGSHAGVAIGADGPSQMGLADIAMFRTVSGSVVLSPCDEFQAKKLTEAMMHLQGISYMRTMREKTPDIYTGTEDFSIGGSKTHGDGPVTVVATGVTVYEALKAQKEIPIRVIDCYSIKPIDRKTLQKAAKETKGIIVVEDHYPEGGLGEAVRTAINGPITHLAVTKMPRSGTPEELLEYEGISAASIVRAVQNLRAL